MKCGGEGDAWTETSRGGIIPGRAARIGNRYSTPQQLARRGRIILSAAAGLNNSQIAREVGLDVDTVRFWRNRWLGLQAAILEDLSIEERLRDAPVLGLPPGSPQQVCQIMSLL